MDDLSKTQPEGEPQSSGEIFNTAEPVEQGQQISQEDQPQYVPAEAQYPAEGEPAPLPDQSIGSAPPPFVEDKRKKYIVFAIVAIIILLVVGVVVGFFARKSQPAPSVNKVTLNYWGLWEDKDLIQPILDDYKRINPNITVNYVVQNKQQYRERLQNALAKGEGPDIFRFHNTWVPMFKNDLTAVPKTIYSDSDFENIFYPVVTSDLKFQGNYYGIPLTIDGLMLYYNEDILKGANIPPPVTWVDAQNVIPKLTVKEKDKIVTAGIAMGTAENVEHFSDILGLMMLQNGTQMTSSLFSCADKSSTSCAVEALTFYRKFAETPNNVWDDTLDNSIVAFAQGKVAFIFAPSWQVFTIKALNPNLNFKTAVVPQLPCAKSPCPSVNWATYWVEGVSVKSKFQKEAWDFLKYLSDESTMKKLYSLEAQSRKFFGEPYSRKELAKTLSDNEYLAPLITEAPSMKSFYTASRTFDGDTGLNSTMIKYLKDAVNSLAQNVSPETALKTVDEGFKQVFSRFGISASVQ